MKNLKFLYLLIFTLNLFSIIRPSDFDNQDVLSMKGKKPQSFDDTVSELESILTDPAFEELQRAHAEFKENKERLGKKLHNKEINDVEFYQQMEQIKDRFKKIKNAFQAKYSSHRLYSFLEVQNLIEKFRELQRAEELPLKIKHLLKKETYNRKQFEQERIVIERKYEAIREFIRTFSQESKATREQKLMSDLQDLQQDYKNTWYNLKNFFLPSGQETYEKELEFQEAERELLQEHHQKYRKILEELKQVPQDLNLENAISRAMHEQQENIAAPKAASSVTDKNQQLDEKAIGISKIKFIPSKL